MEDDEDFLGAVETDNAEGEVIEQPVVAAEPVATVIETPAVTLEPPVIDHKPEPGFVPINAVLDEREKRQKAEAELATLRAQQRPAEQPRAPDMYEDPEGFHNHQAATAQNQALNVKLDLSEDSAREKFGDEIVDKARDWAMSQFQVNPGYQGQVFSQRNPYRYIVEQYQREQIASQVTADDFSQFQAWKAAQAQLANPTHTAAPTASPSPIPPRSLASAPSAGGITAEVNETDKEAFDDVFSRK